MVRALFNPKSRLFQAKELIMNEDTTAFLRGRKKKPDTSAINSTRHIHEDVGRSGVVVSALDLRSEGWWFEAQSLPSCCLDEKLYPTLSLSTQVYKMGTSDIVLGVTLRWTSIPSRGE